MMNINIREAENGYIISWVEEDYDPDSHEELYINKEMVFGGGDDSPESMVTACCDMLRELVEILEMWGGRYDRKRLVIRCECGDKYEPLSTDKIVAEKISYIEEEQ